MHSEAGTFLLLFHELLDIGSFGCPHLHEIESLGQVCYRDCSLWLVQLLVRVHQPTIQGVDVHAQDVFLAAETTLMLSIMKTNALRETHWIAI